MKNLAPILALLSSTRSQLIASADAFPSDRWRTAPTEGKWSAAQIVVHTMQVEESIIRASKKTVQKSPYSVPFFKRFHLPLALAAGRVRKLKSPIAIDESRVPVQSEYAEKITATRRGTLEFIDETRSRDLHPYTFPHPVFGPLNIYDWFRLIAYHELRHAKQIREVAEIFHR
ncbi:MAG: DinB family protein [Candidatus Acidiferrales bacterium]